MSKDKQSRRQAPLVLAFMGLCAMTAHAAETIKIAVPGPMTGSIAQYGDIVRLGTRMAVKRINEAGGVNGKQLEAIELDDACEPKQAVTVANKVVADGIQFVVGHVCTGAIMPTSEIYGNEGIVMITPSGTGPAITEEAAKKGFTTIFRTIGRDDQQSPAAAQYIIERVKPKTVAIIHDKQSYGQGVSAAVKAELETAGIKVAIFEGVNKGDSDFSALITKIKSSGAEFAYFGGYHDVMGLILRQAREQGLTIQFMGPEGVGNSDITSLAGDASEGMLLTLPADFTKDPANADLVKAFVDAKQDPNGPFVMPGYAAIDLIAQAIKGSGSEDPAEVAAYLHANTFKTPIGDVSFDAKGDLKTFKFVVYEWHKDNSKTEAK